MQTNVSFQGQNQK